MIACVAWQFKQFFNVALALIIAASPLSYRAQIA